MNGVGLYIPKKAGSIKNPPSVALQMICLLYTSDLLYDPQTSGGLLISVAPEYLEQMLADFARSGIDTKVSVIGRVAEKSDKLIRLY